jgi:uncharacterized protein (TIGR02996 family)
MTDDELAFLRAAADSPEDDTLRLAYADWLEEHGGEVLVALAAFVRLQVRRSRLDVFDPDRASLLDEEAALLREYRRKWNGRIHRHLHLQGLRGLVDARRGLIRGWDYHRGMIARVTVSAEGLAGHTKLVFSLGPVEALQLVGWREGGWRNRDRKALGGLLPRLKVLALSGLDRGLPDLANLGAVGLVPLLDLRSFAGPQGGDHLLGLARTGAISPVVLFRRTVLTRRTYNHGGRPWTRTDDSRDEVHVIDPFGQWDGLRSWYADLTGEVLSPIPYHGASR